PLSQTRSRSSARSHTDGYSHLRHNDDEEKQQSPRERIPVGVGAEEGKEFEVQFDGDSDPWNPKTKYSTLRKWTIVLIGSGCSLCVTCASALYTSTYLQLEKDFHVSREVATLGLTTYVCGLGLGPMFLSPLSEFFGRRAIYLSAFGMFFIWLIPCAVAQNIQTMLIVRFFDGLAGSAFLSVAGGTVGDVFHKEKLSTPMMVYTASPFLGPELAPVIGGFINSYTNWRWSFWVLLIWAGVYWIMIFAFIPETYAPVLLRRKAIQLRKETGDERYRAPIEIMDRSVSKTVLWSCIRPFQLLFLEPMCLNLCLLSAILLGILYLFFGVNSFETNHDFNEWQVGLTFIGIMVGMILAVLCDPLWRKSYEKLVANNGGVSEPEFRLPRTIVGAIIVPIGLFGFGWTTYRWIHWIVPIVFSGFFGFGIILCYGGIFTFLVECYPLYAASALAANSFMRSSFAAAVPHAPLTIALDLGFQWASSLLAFLALAMTPFPFLFFKYGKRLRGSSRFAQ
ncbi:major facilitator superfamily domain-containing protein, partial [Neohortaea acidophila]